MRWTKAVQRLGVVAAVAALTSVSAGIAATPSYAQTDPVTLDVLLADTVVPAGGSVDDVPVVVDASRETTVENLTYTFDVSGLAGVATIDSPDIPCTPTGTEVVCGDAFPEFLLEGPLAAITLEITADPGAAAGDAGTVTVTIEADGVAPVSDDANVTIGTPVDLVAGGDDELTAAPGDTLSFPWTVQNSGPAAAEGVALRVFSDVVLRPQVQHSNCVYYDIGGTLCTFDVVLDPGTTYEFSSPLAIEVGTDAGAPGFFAVDGIWLTHTEGAAVADELAARGSTGTAGTGPALSLVEVGGGAPAPAPASPLPAADTEPDNNWVLVSVETVGDNQPDFAAVGDQLAGEAGDLVTAEVGLKNLGPATADSGRSGEPLNYFHVILPPGTTATEVPDDCSVLGDDGLPTGQAGTPGADAYVCTAGFLLLVGDSQLFPFALRIDEVIPDATGFVRVNQAIGQPTKPEDSNPDNDEAKIIVNGTGGSGGGLPVTGTATWMVAAAGALLIALGAVAVLLVRRRRARFVA